MLKFKKVSDATSTTEIYVCGKFYIDIVTEKTSDGETEYCAWLSRKGEGIPHLRAYVISGIDGHNYIGPAFGVVCKKLTYDIFKNEVVPKNLCHAVDRYREEWKLHHDQDLRYSDVLSDALDDDIKEFKEELVLSVLKEDNANVED